MLFVSFLFGNVDDALRRIGNRRIGRCGQSFYEIIYCKIGCAAYEDPFWFWCNGFITGREICFVGVINQLTYNLDQCSSFPSSRWSMNACNFGGVQSKLDGFDLRWIQVVIEEKTMCIFAWRTRRRHAKQNTM